MRNNLIFNNANFDCLELLHLVKTRTWVWYVAKFGGVGYAFSDWCISPTTCLGVWIVFVSPGESSAVMIGIGSFRDSTLFPWFLVSGFFLCDCGKPWWLSFCGEGQGESKSVG